ncbi:predicted protein [Histoplasma mississippiense (nom. inval.)]|uniref:predicted protein n=1 Tax=Ajellomyces capsulatus (strain NAm1 / WU24) TaxID=2059318 RepID=UPI000157D5AD|nr:predicted protein [Histoplasma mississippiense (nom. inval.)]EDN05449.1 predicted protein [Histoplasma mississippiense (nom. inval.)]
MNLMKIINMLVYLVESLAPAVIFFIIQMVNKAVLKIQNVSMASISVKLSANLISAEFMKHQSYIYCDILTTVFMEFNLNTDSLEFFI